MHTVENTFQVLTEGHILLFLVQFFALLVFAKLLGLFFIRFKQPTVTADILVGVILGPSFLGRYLPSVHSLFFPSDPLQYSMLDTVAWLGIFFMLLVTGLEVNFSSVWRQKDKALLISISDIIIPVVLSGAVLYFLPDKYLVNPEKRVLFTIFISTIMTISAMPVSIRIMNDFRLLRTDLGFLTISALSINDVVGWVVFTIILGIFTQGEPDLIYTGSLVVFTAIFMVASFTLGRRLVDSLLSMVKKRAQDHSAGSLTVISLTGLALGALTQKIGIHALFGFFVAGLISGEARDLTERTRAIITKMVYAVFVPIFFANIGLKIDMVGNFDLILVALFTIVGISTRFIGAFVGMVLAKAPKSQRWPVAAFHTPGGEMHIVIGALALELSLISQSVFVAIVVAAVLSSVILGPWVTLIMKKMVPASILKILSSHSVELISDTKYDALKELCIVASENSGVDLEVLYGAARSRDEAMSTALENGIAIPHARLSELKEPVVVFGRSRAGIDWDAPDGIPARIIFLICTPLDKADLQLNIYSQIVKVLSDKELFTTLENAPSVDSAAIALNDGLRRLYFTQ